MPHFLSGDARKSVIVMFIIECIGEEMTQSQLSYVILGLDLMGYFELCGVLDTMETEGYIAAVPSKLGQGYGLTAKALEVYPAFAEQLAQSTRTQISDYIDKNRSDIMNNEKYFSNYIRRMDGSYDVVLRVVERDRVLLSMVLNMPNDDYANKAKDNWERSAAAVYRSVIENLVERDDGKL